jgi:hypothetical protein
LPATLPVNDFPLMRAWFVVQRQSLKLLPVQARLPTFLIDDSQKIIDEVGPDHLALTRPASKKGRTKRTEEKAS